MPSAEPASPVAIEVAGLTRHYGDRAAVRGIDLTVGRGELFAFLGPNGAGKTTTIRMLCCLLRPSAGSATVMGHDIRTDPIGAKSVLALSPQETAVAPRLSGRENLVLMARLHGLDPDRARHCAAEVLELLELDDRADEPARRYSGGMQRRLSIAMALVSDPDVLFLDEPTIGLDPRSRRGIWSHIEGLKGHTTVVLTTHYLEEADALADRIAVIDDGVVVALGSPAELKAAADGEPVMVVAAPSLTAHDVDALREAFGTVTPIDGGVEITGADVSLRDIEELLRPRGIEIEGAHRKEITLDDVFLTLTGKDLGP